MLKAPGVLSLRAGLVRGLAAGAAGGLAAGLVGLALGEPALDLAVELEAGGGQELVSRTAQKGGLVAGLVLVGLALGVLFALAYRALPSDVRADPWHRSLALGAGGFAALYLVPFLRYPADPPGVGDASTVDARTSSYLLAVALGLAVVSGAYALARALGRRGWRAPARQSAAVLAAGAVLAGVLPLLADPVDPGAVPAGLLWDVRVASVAVQLTLYGVLAAVFGVLADPALRRPGQRRSAADRRSSV